MIRMDVYSRTVNAKKERNRLLINGHRMENKIMVITVAHTHTHAVSASHRFLFIIQTACKANEQLLHKCKIH